MTLPLSSNIEMPILHELKALSGTDDVRFLYERLIPYFPALSDADIYQIKAGSHKRWKSFVQKAGRVLDEEKFIVRERGIWTLTEKGSRAVSDETSGIIPAKAEVESLSHTDIQQMLGEIGAILGFETEAEFEYYDVVWREKTNRRRLSHVFEVQSKGNIDSAFAKLKRAYDAQRSKPFLILASERDSKRAAKSLSQEFRELQNILVILSFPEIRKVLESLKSVQNILPHFLES